MENNKLIAEFMDYPSNDIWRTNTENKLMSEYHKSWDWLMPVVEKIESLDLKEYGYQWEGHDGETEYNNGSIFVEIEQDMCWIYMNLSLDPLYTLNEKTHRAKFDTKLEATYAAVVEFIEYYNILIKNQDK